MKNVVARFENGRGLLSRHTFLARGFFYIRKVYFYLEIVKPSEPGLQFTELICQVWDGADGVFGTLHRSLKEENFNSDLCHRLQRTPGKTLFYPPPEYFFTYVNWWFISPVST